eukprot:1182882-Prorocentrum_minimum.AAC.3
MRSSRLCGSLQPRARISAGRHSSTTMGGGRSSISDCAPSSTHPSSPWADTFSAPTSTSAGSVSSSVSIPAGKLHGGGDGGDDPSPSGGGEDPSESGAEDDEPDDRLEEAETPETGGAEAGGGPRGSSLLMSAGAELGQSEARGKEGWVAFGGGLFPEFPARKARQKASLRSGVSPPPASGASCTWSSGWKRLRRMEERKARSRDGCASNACTRWPRAAAAKEKKPTPAPTSTSTAERRCPPREPTSASASPGRRVGCTPGCQVPQLVIEEEAPGTGAPGTGARPSSGSSPAAFRASTMMSKGGSHRVETGKRSVTIAASFSPWSCAKGGGEGGGGVGAMRRGTSREEKGKGRTRIGRRGRAARVTGAAGPAGLSWCGLF